MKKKKEIVLTELCKTCFNLMTVSVKFDNNDFVRTGFYCILNNSFPLADSEVFDCSRYKKNPLKKGK